MSRFQENIYLKVFLWSVNMCVFHIEDPGSVLQGYSHESATSGGWQQGLWNLQS